MVTFGSKQFLPLVQDKERAKKEKERESRKEERQMERNKSKVSYETCRDLMKEHFGEGPGDAWTCEDQLFIISKHLSFFKGVAEHSTRLNAVALSLNAQFLWGMDKHKATLWGKSMAMCMSYIWRAGSRATTGEKLSPEVQVVYEIMSGGKIKAEQATTQFKKEPATTKVKSEVAVPCVKAECPQVKIEPGVSPLTQHPMKRSLTSTAQILKLYSITIQDSPAKKQKVHWILYQGGLL